MNRSSHLSALERRAYRTLVDDGLLDLCMGLVFLTFCLSPLLPVPGLPGLALVLLALAWKKLRLHIVEPRVGTVRLGPERVRRIDAGKRVMILVAGLPILTIGLWALLTGEMPPARIEGHGSLIVGIVFGSALLVGGWMLEIFRFWIYAIVLMAAALWTAFVAEPFEEFKWAMTGSTALVFGVIVLVRFLRRYPHVDDNAPPLNLSENPNG